MLGVLIILETLHAPPACAMVTAGSSFVTAGKKRKVVVLTTDDKLKICTVKVCLIKSKTSSVLYQLAHFTNHSIH